MNRKSLLYSGVLLLSLIFVAVLLNRGMVQAVLDQGDAVLSIEDSLVGLGQPARMHLDVAFADGEIATWSGAQLIITNSTGDTVVDALLPLDFKTEEEPGFLVLDGSPGEVGTVVMNGEVKVQWYFDDVEPFDDGGGELDDSTLGGGGKFKGLVGGGVVVFWIEWLSPNDLVWMDNYTAVVDMHVVDGIPGDLIPTNSVTFTITTGLSVSNEEAPEGDSLTFVITINPPVSAGSFLQVSWETAEATAEFFDDPEAPSGGLATDTADYIGDNGTVIFSEAVESVSVTIDTNQDAAWEGEFEIFLLKLTQTFPETFAVTWNEEHGNGIGVIKEDDPPPVLTLPASVSVSEGNAGVVTAAMIELTVSGERDAPFDVTYYTMDGTAISDFGPSDQLAMLVGESNDSGLDGYVTLEDAGSGTIITARLFPANGASVPDIAHLHSGTCDAPGGVTNVLTSFAPDAAGGYFSSGFVPGIFPEDLRQPDAPFLFMSHDDNGPVACGNIPSQVDALVISLDGAAADSGIATLVHQGDDTEVIVSLEGAVESGMAFIYYGDCPTVLSGEAAVLTNLEGIDGDVSVTKVPFALGALVNAGVSIASHSTADSSVAACGEIDTDGFDFVPIEPTMPEVVTFPNGIDTVHVVVSVIGDNQNEPDEHFKVIFADSHETIVNILDDDAKVTEAVDDTYATNEDTTLTVSAPGVLDNDSSATATLTAVKDTEPSSGTLTLGTDGSFEYEPDADFNGTDSFTYHVNDGASDSASATVIIGVTSVNDAPVAVDDAATTPEETPVTIDVLTNDTDVEGDPLTVTNLTQPANGSVVVDVDGTLIYTPDAGFTGPDTFTYTASDGALESGVATVTVTVIAINAPPVAVDDTYSTDAGVALSVGAASGLLANDSDADGDTLSATLDTGVPEGEGILTGPFLLGGFTYDPEGFTGVTSFTYVAVDDSGAANDTSAPATVTITVAAVETPTQDIPLAAGLNFITFGVQLEAGFKANALALAINAQGGNVSRIYKWDEVFGVWVEHNPAISFINNFDLEVGRGYFISVTVASLYQVTGLEIAAPIALNIVAGLTSVGLPVTSQSYTANQLAEAIGAQGGAVSRIYNWDEVFGVWVEHNPAISFINNFVIEPGRGYFIAATAPSVFNP